MPELPEVETIKNQLKEKIIGKKLDGRRIIDVRRRAKLLIIDFKDGSSLIFHLKLTGQLIFNGKETKFTRKIFNFGDGTKLFFNDARKFGWFKFVKSFKDDFGPEALQIRRRDFRSRLRKRSNSKIKPVLMDQKFIAGIGNIYSDEILFAAGVRPMRLVKSLKEQEIKKIFQNIKKILKAAIKHKGSSVEYYLDSHGKKGDYTKYHKVYQKQICQKCGTKINRIKLAGRSSHYCPRCQS